MDKLHQIGNARVRTITYGATVELETSESSETAVIALTGACTVNLASTSTPHPGAKLVVKAASDGTARDITWGTNITGPVLAGVISKTKVVSFTFDGTDYVQDSASVQID